MIYFCCDERRRAELRRRAAEGLTALNGIDFLEVVDREEPAPAERQRTLRIYFVRPIPSPPPPPLDGISAANVRIEGGERVRGVQADQATLVAPESGERYLRIHVNQRGDFSTYTLRLVNADGTPLDGLDPPLAAVDFSFKVECAGDFDCRTERACPPEARAEPEIDYLAKDYASFRQLMLDRLSLLLPDWRERNPADTGIALVELLAYVGDRLSYQQDAVSTEAYLGTARRLVSVRRHARLLDYAMHDGSNARVWAQVRASADDVRLPRGTPLLTRVPDVPALLPPGSSDEARAREARPETFETMEDALLFAAHNEIFFYDAGDRECCLPRGATRATLRDDPALPLRLRAGDVLVFAERLGPGTGRERDADPTRRHPVRLTRAAPATDPLTGQAVVEIEWSVEDALPFPFCLSAVTEAAQGSRYVTDVSVALGNILLADHGRTVRDEPLGAMPAADARLAPVSHGGDRCAPPDAFPPPPRFRPRLKEKPLTQAARVARTAVMDGRRQRLAFDPEASAAAAFRWDLADVLPAALLTNVTAGGTWLPRRDLLDSDAFAPEFVAEADDEGRAVLRFGDDEHGMRPAVGAAFTATYRVGNGATGNVGADALGHVVTGETGITGVWNPLPARGGRDPERIEDVRKSAPAAFRAVLERAVTPDDYARIAERHAEVQRAQATLRWTGSWRTVFLTVDRRGGRPVDAVFETALRAHLERFRMAGHDIEIDGPRSVPLEVDLLVCVGPGYFRGDVETALRAALAVLFHPDNFSFGQPVYLSRILAAAQAVPGVRWVEARRFQRLGRNDTAALDSGELIVGRLEVARLDNDPNFPERGVLRISLEGGR